MNLGLRRSPPRSDKAVYVAFAPHLRRRRAVDTKAYSQLATLSLVREEGLLRWVYEPPPRRAGARRAFRGSGPAAIGTDMIQRFQFQELPPNQILEALEKLDGKLTPAQGLRRWDGKGLASVDRPKVAERALVLIHGTFSKSEMFFDELTACPAGREFLARTGERYKAVLAFDHPTLSLSN